MSATVSVRVEYVNAKSLASSKARQAGTEEAATLYQSRIIPLERMRARQRLFRQRVAGTQPRVRQKAVEEGRCPLRHPKKIKNDAAIAFGASSLGARRHKRLSKKSTTRHKRSCISKLPAA